MCSVLTPVTLWSSVVFYISSASFLPLLHLRAIAHPDHRRALLLRHALHRAPHAGRFPPARHDQVVPGPERLALPPRVDAARRGRGDDLDGTSPVARREEGLPADLLGLLPRHRGRLRA